MGLGVLSLGVGASFLPGVESLGVGVQGLRELEFERVWFFERAPPPSSPLFQSVWGSYQFKVGL